MSDTIAQATVQPPPPVFLLPSQPWEVTETLTAFRVACAKWFPSPDIGVSGASVRACDAVLTRSTDHQADIGIGAIALLGIVVTCVASRAVVKALRRQGVPR